MYVLKTLNIDIIIHFVLKENFLLSFNERSKLYVHCYFQNQHCPGGQLSILVGWANYYSFSEEEKTVTCIIKAIRNLNIKKLTHGHFYKLLF